MACSRWRLSVCHSHKRRKAGNAAIGQFLVAERDRAADRRRVFAFSIRQTSADVERDPIGKLHDQSPQSAFVAATAGLMVDDLSFGIVERFQFE